MGRCFCCISPAPPISAAVERHLFSTENEKSKRPRDYCCFFWRKRKKNRKFCRRSYRYHIVRTPQPTAMQAEPSASPFRQRQSVRIVREGEEEDTGPRYILRNQNLFLMLFLAVSILTVTGALVAIVYAVVEHFWTNLDEPEISVQTAAGRQPAQLAKQTLTEKALNKTIFCFVNPSASSGGPEPFGIDNVSTSLCDAVVFLSVALDAFGSDLRLRGRYDGEQDFKGFTALKTEGSRLTTWVCVGSEARDSLDFRRLVHSKRSRLGFIHNSIAWLHREGLDGLVLYWKYPDEGVRSNYSILINTMRVLFEPENLKVTVVLPWNPTIRWRGYFVNSLYKRLDHVLVDTHHTVNPATFPVTTCQSPIRAVFRARHHGQVGLRSVLDDLSMVTEHLLKKTVLGVSLRGISFTLRHSFWPHRAGTRTVGPGAPFGFTNRSGLASYYDIAEALLGNSSWSRFLHGYSRCAVAYWKDQWIGYENVASLWAKQPLVRKTAGLAVWDLPMDDFAGVLGPPWPLLRQVYQLVHGLQMPAAVGSRTNSTDL